MTQAYQRGPKPPRGRASSIPGAYSKARRSGSSGITSNRKPDPRFMDPWKKCIHCHQHEKDHPKKAADSSTFHYLNEHCSVFTRTTRPCVKCGHGADAHGEKSPHVCFFNPGTSYAPCKHVHD